MVVVLGSGAAQASKQQNGAKLKSARLLWLGDKQVGKSASIVRYTTGRFIQEYSPAASNDWLYYKRPAAGGCERQPLVELLEQKDIQFSNSGNFFAPQTKSSPSNANGSSSSSSDHGPRQSLSSRVALDQLIDQELYEKQQMLERLHWADAYVVVYSISDTQTFQKAIKYLNLIANNVNSPAGGEQPLAAGRLSTQLMGQCANGSATRRPILLLGNKRDLEQFRQVQTSDGRHLAIRHKSMFAELSVAQTGRQLEQLLAGLLNSIEPANPQAPLEHLITSCKQLGQTNVGQRKGSYPLIGLWRSRRHSSESHHRHQTANSLQLMAPARASLVRSQPVCASSLAQSCRALVGSGELAAANLVGPANGGSKVKSSSLESVGGQTQAQQTVANNNSSSSSGKGRRYENFKSSFKKASMAIVGSRALSKRTSTLEPGDKLPASESPAEGSASSGQAPGGDRCSAAAIKESLKRQRQRNLASQQSSSSSAGSASLQSVSSTGWLRSRMRLNKAKPGAGSSDPITITTGAATTTTTATESAPAMQAAASGGSTNTETLSERMRRPLLKYTSRRKTVAFEQIDATAIGIAQKHPEQRNSMVESRKQSIASHSALSFLSSPSSSAAEESAPANGGQYDSARQGSGRSSCSLSAGADTCNGSLLVLLGVESLSSARPGSERAPSSVGSASVCSGSCSPNNSSSRASSSQQLNKSMSNGNARRQNNSHSRSGTLSRGSTSTCEDMSADEHQSTSDSGAALPTAGSRQVAACYAIQRVGSEVATICEMRPAKLATAPSCASLASNDSQATKRRYRLVKSVQNTLTNLTRSSNVNTGGQQAAKRSICTGLFRSATAQASRATIMKSTVPLIEPKTEQVHVMPIIVGYCK